jgi:hypothetical protein
MVHYAEARGPGRDCQQSLEVWNKTTGNDETKVVRTSSKLDLGAYRLRWASTSIAPRLICRTEIAGRLWPLKRAANNVRFGSKADICSAPTHVRFAPNSDRESGLPHKVMSALPPKADMCGAKANVRYGPKADIHMRAKFPRGFQETAF